ncbi:DUF4834 family protein [Pontibacter ruber]|uniref:DUF4834 family protein n=1 Tax=Pontibacter ruber TaxID=1343895 RepID=A0ABW5D392_9BACT|nr:DUF4834 family protein [Pontibacter ruber]
MAFLKFILVTILVIYFIRLVAPFLFRFLLGMFLKKKMRNGTFFYTNMNQQRQYQDQQQRSNGRAQGNNIKIDYIPEQPERRDFNGGEYVDYEEVK